MVDTKLDTSLTRNGSSRDAWFPWVACALGLAMMYWPTFSSGFAFIQTDTGDSRLVNFILEHSWRWVTGHASFWDPPIFYPAKGVTAWCENLVGVAPIYWLWRALGFAHDTSFQLWAPSVSALNFFAAYRMLRGPAGRSRVSSGAGAWLFAFAALRVNQLCHHQMLGVFWTAWAVHALLRLQERPGWRWAVALGLAIAGQLFAGIYLGWFLVFGLCVYAAVSVAEPTGVLRWGMGRWYAGAGATAAFAFFHFYARYREAGQLFGFWKTSDLYIPHWRAWFDLGGGSWFYAWTAQDIGGAVEYRLGLGFLTLALCVAGLWLHRPARSLLVAWGVLVAVATWGWLPVFTYFPGANGIRTASRVGELTVLVAAFGLSYVVDLVKLRAKSYVPGLFVLLAAVALEQGTTTGRYSKEVDRQDIERIASQLRWGDCGAFLFSPLAPASIPDKYQLDAMWAALETGVPTLNGYSGHTPPGWDLGVPYLDFDDEEEDTRAHLEGWATQTGLDPQRICLIRAPNS